MAAILVWHQVWLLALLVAGTVVVVSLIRKIH